MATTIPIIRNGNTIGIYREPNFIKRIFECDYNLLPPKPPFLFKVDSKKMDENIKFFGLTMTKMVLDNIKIR